jgi:hypothetical protein
MLGSFRKNLRKLPATATLGPAYVSDRAVEKLRAGRLMPKPKTERKLTALAVAHARRRLSEVGLDARDDHESLARYLNLR